ncbi:MAG: GUN4 domain-containing protein [Sphaerospermopsis sp. SIO1G1]|nr:GUN4 domain-containing protein [Sphaerospermopsis sp. SIO1G1]
MTRKKTGSAKTTRSNKETYEVMIKAIGKKYGDIFTSDELLHFPCQHLCTIDKLWVKYSDGRFGFSIQKEMYESIAGKPNAKYDKEALNKLCKTVGWRKEEGDFINYSELYFNTKITSGYLPLCVVWGRNFGCFGRSWRKLYDLFSRIETCKP